MLKKLLKLPHTLLHFLFLAVSSNYSSREKVEVFSILTQLWLKSIFFDSKKQVTQHIFGQKVSAHSPLVLFDMFKEIYVAEVYRFSSKTPAPTIIDCGANIGISILYLKKYYPEARIIAFEPDPQAFILLQQNILQNNISQVTLYPTALSNTIGKLSFYQDTAKGHLNSSLLQHHRTAKTLVEVEAKKLSDFIFGEAHIDLIKMDIEGAEHAVLKDLSQNGLPQQAGQYIIEYHHHVGHQEDSLSSFLRIFEEHHFQYYLKNIFPKVDEHQDILLHCYLADDV